MNGSELYQDVAPALLGSSRTRLPLSQIQRRRLVLALYGGALLAAWFLLPQRPVLATLPGYPALLLSLWAYWRLATRANPELVTPRLDERQLLHTALAYRTAYNTAFILLCLGGPYLILASGFGWPMPHTQDDWLGLLAVGVLPLGMTLPTAILAWTEPDLGEL